MKETLPLSDDLSRIGAIGLQALDYADRHKRPPAGWVAREKAFLENAKKLRAELRLAVAGPVQKLVEMAGR